MKMSNVSHDVVSPSPRRRLSRRVFLTWASLGLLAGCTASTTPAPTPTSSPPTVTPTSPPPPTSTPAPSATPVDPTATPEAPPSATPGLPDARGRVVRARHPAGADPDLGAMLDAALVALTQLESAAQAWSALFAPDERVAIKVNTIGSSGYWTPPALVTAVTARLQEVGVPAEQIVIFDRQSRELESAGYRLNREGPGVRCYGTDDRMAEGWEILGTPVRLSEIVTGCDALINLPILKQHGMAGISFAMKNHYGTFDKPWQFHHGEAIARGMAQLNALDPIRDRTRLIVGAALDVIQGGWHSAVPADTLTMSFDPVAHDAVGLRVYDEVMSAEGRSTAAAWDRAGPWLEAGADLGLGTDVPEEMEVVVLDDVGA